jgi:thiosulfate reductase/polysulfide reductase chain A
MSSDTIFSVCGMCPVRCPIEVAVEDGACRFVQGNRQIAGIRGALCTRGAAAIPLLRDDERPQFPMRRLGERGQGRWERISWEGAFAYAAEKIEAVRARNGGPGLLWADTGGPFSDMRQAFARALGTPNFFTDESIHGANAGHAALSLFGFGSSHLTLDLRHARHTVLQGRNLFESVDIRQANDLLDGMENGGRLTVIDVRATVSAAKADRFLRIRPGTDYALNLAVIHTLLHEGLHRPGAAGNWIADLDELGRMVEPYTPQFAAKETGLPAADIVGLARDLAQAAPQVVWHPGWKTSRYSDSFFVCRTAYIINAILGAVGTRGGLPLSVQPEDIGRKGLRRFTDLFPSVAEKRADGVGWKTPAFEGGPGLLHEALRAVESGDPYPVKAGIFYQLDPLAELPDPERLKGILARLDFLMCITSSWSETAWQADLILPLSTHLERESLLGQLGGVKPAFMMRRRCVPPRFETRADWEIVSGLAGKLGAGPLALPAIEAVWRFQLEGTGVGLRDFDAKGVAELAGRPHYGKLSAGYRFPTDSGRIEMVSFRWRRQGIPSLGPYAARPAPGRGSFRLTLGGCGAHAGGHTVNNPLLHRQMPENVLWMNPGPAADLGIADGETVSVSSGERAGRIKVKLTEHIHPEAVFMVRGFGRTLPVESRACGRGIAHNRLMPGGLDLSDSAGGGVALQEHFVTVTKR